MWRRETEKMGGVMSSNYRHDTEFVARFTKNLKQENKDILLEWISWIFKNWEAIKQKDNLFKNFVTPPLKTFLSDHVSDMYLTKFKKEPTIEKEITWTGEVKEWQKVRTKKGQLNQKFKDGKGE